MPFQREISPDSVDLLNLEDPVLAKIIQGGEV